MAIAYSYSRRVVRRKRYTVNSINTFSASRSRNLLIHQVTVTAEWTTLPFFTEKTRDITRSGKCRKVSRPTTCRFTVRLTIFMRLAFTRCVTRRVDHATRKISSWEIWNCAKKRGIVRSNDRARGVYRQSAVTTRAPARAPSPTNPNLERRHSRMSSTCVDVCARWISHAASESAGQNRTLSQTSPGTASRARRGGEGRGEGTAPVRRSRLYFVMLYAPIRHFAAIRSGDPHRSVYRRGWDCIG